jgi:hypothetical protein
MSVSLQMVLVADAHLAEGQILHKKPTVNKGKSIKL